MKTAWDMRTLGTRVLLATSLTIFAATASYGNPLSAGPESARPDIAISRQAAAELRIEGNNDPQARRCQSQRCRNRQHRRIMRANCRLDGGRPSPNGRTCTIPFEGR